MTTAAGKPTLLQLTPREQEIVALLLEGCSNKQIADHLGVSSQTVKNQLSTLFQKASVRNRLALVAQVLRNGIASRSAAHRDA